MDNDDKLYECFLKYNELMKYNYTYKLDGGITFTLKFKKEDLPHLLGLHKLIDYNIFKQLADKKHVAGKIYKMIAEKDKANSITYDYISKSQFFNVISNRIDNFHSIKDLLFSQVIINFDNSKIDTKLESNVILFEKKTNKYLHLCIVNKNHKTYPETFIVESSNYYVKDQDRRLVKNIEIEDFKAKTTKTINFGK